MLFTPKLDPAEAVLITGAERFGAHEGYHDSLSFVGPFADTTPTLKERGTRHGDLSDGDTLAVTVTAFDAVFYPRGTGLAAQLASPAILRELLKATVAFGGGGAKPGTSAEGPLPEIAPGAPVATGNWGCGVFNGHAQLKAVLQWLAVAEAGRPMHYYPFGNPVGAALEAATLLLPPQRPLPARLLFQALGEWSARFLDAPPDVQAALSDTLLVDVTRRRAEGRGAAAARGAALSWPRCRTSMHCIRKLRTYGSHWQ